MPATNSFLQSIVQWLSRWLGAGDAQPASQPAAGQIVPVQIVPDNRDEPVQALSPRVLVVVFDPILDPQTGRRLSQTPEAAQWSRVDDLLAGYIADVDECSGGVVKYRVTGRTTVDYFPIKEDKFTYDAASYLQALHTARYHPNDWMDYGRILDDLQLLQRVAQGEFDEVWFFGGPGFGFYESRMAGPGAFWCNAPQCPDTSTSRRRFVIMGFSYERGVGEMLEDLGHRAESVMEYRWRNVPANANLWKKFSRYDAIAPGQAEVGMMHWAPNSVRDYDWGNPRPVLSRADDWQKFPDLTGQPRTMTCADWGNGDIRAHHKWWFKHFPNRTGRTNGVANQWWRYVINVADRELD